MCASLVTYPHEVLRTRLQIQRTGANQSNPSNPTTLRNSSSSTTATSSIISSASIQSNAQNKPASTSVDLKAHGPKQKEVTTPSGSSSKSRGLVDIAKGIWQQDGWKGFYRGITVNMARTIPAAALTMLT